MSNRLALVNKKQNYKWHQIVDQKNDVDFILSVIENTDEFIAYICTYCFNQNLIKYLLDSKKSYLLLDCGTNGWFSGYYPVHYLFSFQPTENLRFILDSNCLDIFVPNTFSNETPLHILCWRNDRKEVVLIFINYLLKNLKMTREQVLFEFSKQALYCGLCDTPYKVLEHFNCLTIIESIL